ncbi:MAG: hemolysin family protein [bacterium]
MEADSYFLLVFILLLVLSALFSGTETAFLSLSDFDLNEFRKKATKRSLRTVKLLSNPKSLFVAIKFASLVVNTAIICVGFLLSQSLAHVLGIAFGFALVFVMGAIVILLFVISEFWSNLIVLSYHQAFAKRVSLPILLYYRMVNPFANIIAKIVTFLSTKLAVLNKSSYLNHHKIMAMVEDGDEVGNLEDSERAMIHSIFEFGETEVHEIMVPRIDMVCVEENINLEELTNLIKEKGHSRIPLYREGVDNILGIIHAKDLLRIIKEKESSEKIDLIALARPAYFVPESKKLHHLLKEFQQEKSHMAIVVDEYGGTAGLVTLEDVIEEIVGDIQDEYDQEPPLYRKLDENTFMVDAKIDLHELNEILEIEIPTEGEYESLGGFILSLTGYVPEEKEVVEYNSYKFVVEKIERNRIVWVKITRDKPELETEMNSNELDT